MKKSTQKAIPTPKKQLHALFGHHEYKGEKTSLKSLVKPGDALTPLQIANQVKMGFDFRDVYVDETIQEFINMDRIDKLQFIREKNMELEVSRQQYLRDQEALFQQQLKQKRKKEDDALIKQHLEQQQNKE